MVGVIFLVLFFCLFAFLLFKMFKALLTIILCLFFIIGLAFFLRSQDVLYFEIPESFEISDFKFELNKELKKEINETFNKENKEEKEDENKKIETEIEGSKNGK